MPPRFQTFFTQIREYLTARTTDVLTAHCCVFIEPLCNAIEAAHPKAHIDRDVVTLAFILHDCG